LPPAAAPGRSELSGERRLVAWVRARRRRGRRKLRLFHLDIGIFPWELFFLLPQLGLFDCVTPCVVSESRACLLVGARNYNAPRGVHFLRPLSVSRHVKAEGGERW